MTPDQIRRIKGLVDGCESAIEAYAKSVRAKGKSYCDKLDMPRWMGEKDSNIELFEDYCRKCARKELREMIEGDKYEVICGHSPDGSDRLKSCCKCEKFLDCFLTEYGADCELCRFEEDKFSPRRVLDCWIWHLCEIAFVKKSDEWYRLMILLLPEERHRRSKTKREMIK